MISLPVPVLAGWEYTIFGSCRFRLASPLGVGVLDTDAGCEDVAVPGRLVGTARRCCGRLPADDTTLALNLLICCWRYDMVWIGSQIDRVTEGEGEGCKNISDNTVRSFYLLSQPSSFSFNSTSFSFMEPGQSTRGIRKIHCAFQNLADSNSVENSVSHTLT